MSDALVIFKPDAAHRLAARAGIWSWLSSEDGWKLESLSWFKPPSELIEKHYDFLQDRPFFPWLVDFMTALPLLVGRVTATPEVLEKMRYDLGETRIAQSRPGSLRERFGISGGINCVHLSDAPERSLATQVSAGVHVGLASQAIKDLLAEETDLDGEDLAALDRIILGALT